MTKAPIAVYLHDHLAGAAYALDLVEAIQRGSADPALQEFASQLHSEITTDKNALHDIAQKFGPASDPVKDTAAWFSEKISRLKLKHTDGTGLGTFEALEFLRLGIQGKAALWEALVEVARENRLLSGIDFAHLLQRAHDQVQAVEKHRLAYARQVLSQDAEV